MIKIEHLSKSFGKNKVLNDLSLNLKKGQRLAIIAPSGSGKTTLLRIISGLEKKYSGKCEVNGKVSYMFQENRLFEFSTVSENILAVTDSKERASQLIKAVELEEYSNALPQSLSGGMKRRVALARALAYDFDILLLDEPFTGLDEDLKARIIHNIEKSIEGKTVILVTHSEKDAQLLNCRINNSLI